MQPSNHAPWIFFARADPKRCRASVPMIRKSISFSEILLHFFTRMPNLCVGQKVNRSRYPFIRSSIDLARYLEDNFPFFFLQYHFIREITFSKKIFQVWTTIVITIIIIIDDSRKKEKRRNNRHAQSSDTIFLSRPIHFSRSTDRSENRLRFHP